MSGSKEPKRSSISKRFSFSGRSKEKEPLLESKEQSSGELQESNSVWDMAFVFRNPDDPKGEKLKGKENWKDFVSQLSKQSISTSCYLSVGQDEVYVLVGATSKRFAEQAALLDYKLELDKDALEKATDAYFKSREAMIDGQPPHLGLVEGHETYCKYDFIYSKYVNDEGKQHLFKKALPSRNDPFRSTDRIKLLYSMIEGEDFKGGADIDVGGCLAAYEDFGFDEGDEDKFGTYGIMAGFPLHDAAAVNELYANWVVTWQWPWKQPVALLRSYFGEKAGLYFGFLCHYCEWLMYLAIPGVIVEINEAIQLSTEALLVPYFAIFVTLWAVFMLEGWKRKENRYAMEWGMTDFEDVESDRPEFGPGGAIKMYSPVNGEVVQFYPEEKRAAASNKSMLTIFFMLLLVIATLAAVYTLKIMLDSPNGIYPYLEESVPVAFQAIAIQILNGVYRDMAFGMTDRENHQTDTKYEDSLVGKLYLFTFVNSYAPLFFIAFVAIHTSFGCEKGSCMNYLAYTLTTIFVMNLFVSNITETVLPYKEMMDKRAKEMAESEGGEPAKGMTRAEHEFTMGDYDPMGDTIQDFTTISIEFGYVVLFVTAFPIAPFLAFLNEYTQIRTDGWKLCRVYKRCQPVGAQDIGIWQSIFTMTAYASVVCNAAIVVFVMGDLHLPNYVKVWCFILFQYVLLAILVVADVAIPDVPEEVVIQTDRSKFFEDAIVLENEPDNDKISDFGLSKEPGQVQTSEPPQMYATLEESLEFS